MTRTPTRAVVAAVVIASSFGLTGVAGAAQPASSMTCLGKSGDLVNYQPVVWNQPDGYIDGLFRVTLVRASGKPTTLDYLRLTTPYPGMWDTGGSGWPLGVTAPGSTTLLNASATSISLAAKKKVVLDLHADDGSTPVYFGAGASFSLDAEFADGSMLTVSCSEPAS